MSKIHYLGKIPEVSTTLQIFCRVEEVEERFCDLEDVMVYWRDAKSG